MYFAYLWKGCRSYLKEIEALNVVTEEYGIQNEEEQAMILKQIAVPGRRYTAACSHFPIRGSRR